MKKLLLLTTFLLVCFLNHSPVEARTIRATEMNEKIFNEFKLGKFENVIVEFRQGDELPINFQAKGDFLESTNSVISYVEVKRNFWLKMEKDQVKASLDGQHFKDLSAIATGSFQIGAGRDTDQLQLEQGEVAKVIKLAFEAYLRKPNQ